MKKFRIETKITEVTTAIYFIEAETEEQAAELWENGDSEPYITYEGETTEEEMISLREGTESEEEEEDSESTEDSEGEEE